MVSDVSELVNEILSENDGDILSGNDTIPQKRGPGRPPKIATTSSPKKRGRPPKAKGFNSGEVDANRASPKPISTGVQVPIAKDSDSDDTINDDKSPIKRSIGTDENPLWKGKRTSPIVRTPRETKPERPPRVAKSIPIFYGEEKDEYELVEENNGKGEASSNKRLGRPRKYSDDEEPPRKRRGRPPGSAKKTPKPQNEEEGTENDENDGEPPKKRRGRPPGRGRKFRQSVSDDNNEEDESNDDSIDAENTEATSRSGHSARSASKPKPARTTTWDENHFTSGIRVSAYFECSPEDPEAKMMPSAADRNRLLPMKLYDGVVTAYSASKREPLYHVVWEDGDEEDYDVYELLQGVLKFQNRRLGTAGVGAPTTAAAADAFGAGSVGVPDVNSPGAFL